MTRPATRAASGSVKTKADTAPARPEPPPKPGRAADSVDKAYETIKEMAVDYRFKPGERVNEVELAGRLSVSRTPVREALNRLVSDGFMSFVPNRGFFARDITPDGVRDLYELRAAIERAAFRLACERAGDDEIEKAASIWEKRRDGGATPDWAKVAEADERFHVAVARLSKNAQLVETLEGINSRIRFFRKIDLETPRRRTGTYDEHAAIIACLRKREAEPGAQVVERHITLSSAHAIEMTKEGLARIFFGRQPTRNY